MSKAALLIIDMQKNCYKETSDRVSFERAVTYINKTSEIFRIKNYPVIIIQDTNAGGPGTEAFPVVDEILVSDKDHVIHKQSCNAFWETELDGLLKREGIDCVIVSGFAAQYCVLFTYNGAIERGYKAFILQNGVAGSNEGELKELQWQRHVISHEALEYFL